MSGADRIGRDDDVWRRDGFLIVIAADGEDGEGWVLLTDHLFQENLPRFAAKDNEGQG